METAPRDDTLLILLVEFEDNSLEDTSEPVPTIGANGFDNTGEDEWKFAGWNWNSDEFTRGYGKPIGWLPWEPTVEAASFTVTQHHLDEIERLNRINQGLRVALQTANAHTKSLFEKPIKLLTPTEVMNVVMDYQHNKNTNVTGTTNWAANIGMAVVDAIRKINESGAV